MSSEDSELLLSDSESTELEQFDDDYDSEAEMKKINSAIIVKTNDKLTELENKLKGRNEFDETVQQFDKVYMSIVKMTIIENDKTVPLIEIPLIAAKIEIISSLINSIVTEKDTIKLVKIHQEEEKIVKYLDVQKIENIAEIENVKLIAVLSKLKESYYRSDKNGFDKIVKEYIDLRTYLKFLDNGDQISMFEIPLICSTIKLIENGIDLIKQSFVSSINQKNMGIQSYDYNINKEPTPNPQISEFINQVTLLEKQLSYNNLMGKSSTSFIDYCRDLKKFD